jgi:hypothetical protein
VIVIVDPEEEDVPRLMPYVPLSLPDHVPEPVIRQVIRPVVDVALREIRLIMMIGDPESGPKGALQLSIARLLLSAIDEASNLLVSGERHNGPRFRRFLRENFAWERIEAEQASVCEFMWESARCALIHRYGLHTTGDLRKFGRLFSIDDSALTALEEGQEPSKPFFERDAKRTVVWIEPLYWGLRQAIVKALDTPAKAVAVVAHLKSGQWDPSRDRTLQSS